MQILNMGAVNRGVESRYSPGVLLGNWYEEMRQKEDQLKLFQRQRDEAVAGGRSTFSGQGKGGPFSGLGMVEEEAVVQRLLQPVDTLHLLATLPTEEKIDRHAMEEGGGCVASFREAHMVRNEVLSDGLYRPEYPYVSWAPMPCCCEEGVVANWPPELPGVKAAEGGCQPTGCRLAHLDNGWDNESPERRQRCLRECHLRPTHPNAGPPPSVAARGPRVPFGVPLMLMSVKTGAALAVDCIPRRDQGMYEVLVTASRNTVPLVRTTWTLFPCADDNNGSYHSEWLKEPNILHYGQRVRIGNENITECGIYYLQAGLENGYNSSIAHKVMGQLGACADNVFVIGRPGYRRGNPTSDGYPVRMGDPISLVHVSSNQPLCCVGDGDYSEHHSHPKVSGVSVRQSTRFGVEYSVVCALDRRDRYGLSRGDVVVRPENMFYFATGKEGDCPRIKSPQSVTGMAQTLPMSVGDTVEKVWGDIRAGAIHMGGRLGLRPLSLALRTAGAEGRYPFSVSRQQLLEAFAKIGVCLLPIQLDVMMKSLDHTGNEVVDALECMHVLRGAMNPDRMKAVVSAFQRILMEQQGGIDFTDMLHLYRENSHGHPDVVDGLITREEACKDFEVCWPSNVFVGKLGTVRLDEFVMYYADLSPAVDDDRRFCATLRNCWMIPLTDAYRKGVPFRVITVEHLNGEKETVRVPHTMKLNPSNTEGIYRMLNQHGVYNIKDFSVSNVM